jgi:acid phosphatase (class A)
MPNVRTIAALTLSLLITCAAGVSAHDTVSFVTADQVDVGNLLPSPPADGSATQQSELQELHNIQATRTPAMVAAAEADASERDMFIYRPALGPAFSPSALPMVTALSADIQAAEPVVIKAAKHYFDRERPFVADPTLHNVCPAESGSYPSSHATNAYLQADVLAAMVPEMRAAIFARANNYAYNRLVCGVHYPSDLQAGKTVADAMMGPMMNNPAFQTDFARAQTELRHALNLPAMTAMNASSVR